MGLRSELLAAGSGGGGSGVGLGHSCCALAQSRLWSLWSCLVLLLPEEHPPGSSGWVGWDIPQDADGQNPGIPTVFPLNFR